jgi:DNA repair photolyase
MRKRILFRVEKNRVLVPVGEPCQFACRYCYTRGGEVGLSPVNTDDILARFKQFAQETPVPFATIQFGYDGDPFSRPERGLSMLQQLATMDKNINFSTKAALNSLTLNTLDEIRSSMDAIGTVLSALVSLSCWDSAPAVEPHTPSPSERILTVANLKDIEIPTFIAIRPMLPHIPDYEYERIVDEGILAGCDGFILGPLYSDKRGQFTRFIPPAVLAQIPSRTNPVSWSAHAPTWTRYEDASRLQRLLLMIEHKGGRTFVSSADAMALVHSKEAAA